MSRVAAQVRIGARSRVGVVVVKRHVLALDRARRLGQREARRRATGSRNEIDGAAVAAERVRRALGDHAAARDHDDAVGEVLRLVHVVRGQQDRLAERAQAGDQLPRVAPRGGIEARRRLVEEDQLRVAGDAEREVEPAPLAAGERVGARRRPSPRARPARSPRARRAGRVGGAVELDRLAHRDRRGRSRPPAGRCRSARRNARSRLRGVEAEHADLAGVGAAVAFEDLDGASSCRRRWGRARRAPRRGGPSGRCRRRALHVP